MEDRIKCMELDFIFMEDKIVFMEHGPAFMEHDFLFHGTRFCFQGTRFDFHGTRFRFYGTRFYFHGTWYRFYCVFHEEDNVTYPGINLWLVADSSRWKTLFNQRNILAMWCHALPYGRYRIDLTTCIIIRACARHEKYMNPEAHGLNSSTRKTT